MLTFILCISALILGYIFYARYIDKTLVPDDRETPALKNNDGVDYIPMPTWKVFLIQLLNIAGTGPIFGALSGAIFGPVVYIWIVFGCIFAGGVHDYMIGMISERSNGASVSEIIGTHLGNKMRNVMRVFSVILLIMCGVVFTTGPADLLGLLTPDTLDANFWLYVLIGYYFLATFLPIDKIIGKIYPLFGACLIIMALGVSGAILFSDEFQMPELWNNFFNTHPQSIPIWPFMFITVACGAISGFHATQSPMMSRCIKSERQGKKVFFGAMVAEGIIALIWAAAGVTVYENSQALLDAGGGCSAVVYQICQSTMGKIGSILALIGVIVCPISSGDTAYRSARLTLADWLKFDQKDWKKRLYITLPLLCVGLIICNIDYSTVWRYFSWSNQTLAMICLWGIAVYLKNNNKNCKIAVIPAIFMTAVTTTYFVMAPECLGKFWQLIGIDTWAYQIIGITAGIILSLVFLKLFFKKTKGIRLKVYK